MSDSYQYEIKQGERPRFLDDGDKAVLIDRREYRVNAERALIAQFVCQRRLFGMVYSRLCKNVFDSLREGGGVFLSGLVPSEELLKITFTNGSASPFWSLTTPPTLVCAITTVQHINKNRERKFAFVIIILQGKKKKLHRISIR